MKDLLNAYNMAYEQKSDSVNLTSATSQKNPALPFAIKDLFARSRRLRMGGSAPILVNNHVQCREGMDQ